MSTNKFRPLKYDSYYYKKFRSKLLAQYSQCSIFPFLSSSHIHHTNYKNIGSEKIFRDVLPLSKFAHFQIIHGLLSLWKRPRNQKKYPNIPQKIFHFWAILPTPAKILCILNLILIFILLP